MGELRVFKDPSKPLRTYGRKNLEKIKIAKLEKIKLVKDGEEYFSDSSHGKNSIFQLFIEISNYIQSKIFWFSLFFHLF